MFHAARFGAFKQDEDHTKGSGDVVVFTGRLSGLSGGSYSGFLLGLSSTELQSVFLKFFKTFSRLLVFQRCGVYIARIPNLYKSDEERRFRESGALLGF